MKPIKFLWILHYLTPGTLFLPWGQCPSQGDNGIQAGLAVCDPCEYSTHRDGWVHTVLKNLFTIKADLGPSVNSCLLLTVQLQPGNIMYCFPLFLFALVNHIKWGILQMVTV